jgi:hypothetical protein
MSTQETTNETANLKKAKASKKAAKATKPAKAKKGAKAAKPKGTKKLGLKVESTKSETGERTYRIVG